MTRNGEKNPSRGRDLNGDGLTGETGPLAGNLKRGNLMHLGYQGGGENPGANPSLGGHHFFLKI